MLEQALAFRIDELAPEFANREMTELADVAADVTAAGRDLAAGVIDVKSSYLETADDVAWCVDRLLDAGVDPNRLHLLPDCGFSQTSRAATRPSRGAGRGT